MIPLSERNKAFKLHQIFAKSSLTKLVSLCFSDHGAFLLPSCFLLAQHDVLQHLVDISVSHDTIHHYISFEK